MNQWKQFRQNILMQLFKLEGWWETIEMSELQKTIKQLIIYCGYPTIYLLSDISKSIE